MKNKILTLAGSLALLAVLGKFYAAPAIAQAVRAALVQDRDNPARQPFSYWQVFNPPNTTDSAYVQLPQVPSGKRRIINGVFVSVTSGVTCSARIFGGPIGAPSFGNPTFAANFLAPELPVLGAASGSLSPIQFVMNPQDLGIVEVFCNPAPSQTEIALTGFDIDIP